MRTPCAWCKSWKKNFFFLFTKRFNSAEPEFSTAAFRFYMGRNELLSDSQTLIDADHSYVQSGGSFKAVIISLLTSDSFIYRK